MGIFDAPEPPDPPPVQPDPEPPKKTGDKKGKKAREEGAEQRRRAAKRRGRASTILTGADEEPEPLGRTRKQRAGERGSLLGGS